MKMADRDSKYGRQSFNRNRQHYQGSGNFPSSQNRIHFQGNYVRNNEIRQPHVHGQHLDGIGRNLTGHFSQHQQPAHLDREIEPAKNVHFTRPHGQKQRQIDTARNVHFTGPHRQQQQNTDVFTRQQQRLPPSSPSSYFNEPATRMNNNSQAQLNAVPQRALHVRLETPFLTAPQGSTASQGSMVSVNKQTASNQSFARLPSPVQLPVPLTAAVRPQTTVIPTQLILDSGPIPPQMIPSTDLPPPHLVQSSAVSPLRLAQPNGGQPPLFHSTAVPPPHLSQPVSSTMTSLNQLPQPSNIHLKPPDFEQAFNVPPLQAPQSVVKQPPSFTGTSAVPPPHTPQFVAVPPPQLQQSVLPPHVPVTAINQLPSQQFQNLASPRTDIPTGRPHPMITSAGKPVAREHLEQQGKDQKWIEKFVLERNLAKDKDATRSSGQEMKISHAKKLFQEWHDLLEVLDKQNIKLRTVETVGLDDTILRQELEKAQKLRARIVQLQTKLSDLPVLEQLKLKLEQRKKKREWWRRMRNRQYNEKMEADSNRIQLHRKIDEWREKIIASDQAKLRAQAMKSEAGGAMGEVRRKLVEANKALESLKALRKLRGIRQQEAEVKGVYPRPTREANKRFDEKMTLLETLMNKQQQLYATEERTLKVMMAEEEEEKDKETRKKFRHEMRQHGQAEVKQYDPMDEFQRFYNQAELSLGSLLHVRRQWDLYIVPETVPGSSRIPDGLVSPVEPCSSIWATVLQDKISSAEPS